MNAFGIALVWCAAQVTLVALFAAALYLAAKRMGPAVRALIVQTSLLIFVALALLAFSPWPRWSTPGRATSVRNETELSPALPIAAAPDEQTSVAKVRVRTTLTKEFPEPATTAPPTIDFGELAAGLWNSYAVNLPVPATAQQTDERRWPMFVAILFLLGTAAALLRIIVGLRSVHAYRRTSLRVVDRRALELLDVVAAELGCCRKIELRETSELATAATTGWRRPVIFLPVEWQQWTPAQMRAVLAHEVSHIARNDFLTSVCARVGVAVHFYHPLVHWLMRRLCLEQELAADAAAARVAGGQRNYLTILAEMALAQSNRPVRWPARTFLPTRGTFLRRIEMLRDSKNLSRSVSPKLRVLAVALLAIAGLAAAGFRPPSNDEGKESGVSDLVGAVALGDDRLGLPETPAAKSKGIDVANVAADAAFFAAIRPAEILGTAEWKALLPIFDETMQLSKVLGSSVAEIEQVSMYFLGGPENAPALNNAMLYPMMVIQMTRPSDFASFIASDGQQFDEHALAGKKYFVSRAAIVKAPPGPSNRQAYLRPDERSIVLGTERQVTRLLSGERGGVAPIFQSANWARVKDAPAVLIADSSWAKTMGVTGGHPMLAMMAPVVNETTSLAALFAFGKGLDVAIFAECQDDAGAETVKSTIEAAVTLGKNAIENIPVANNASPPEQAGQTVLLQTAKSLLNSTRIEQESNLVTARATLADNADLLAQLATQAATGVRTARAAADRITGRNNLKQIGLAMHSYYDVHKHLPPAVAIGPDGKTPHSWRVALLPFLGLADLHKQYRTDEPWDSEHNKQLLSKVPAVFRDPRDSSNEPISSYYVLTGKGTIFESKEGTEFRQIKDGTSNTIMIVEAKRDVPWTKPEDIVYDPEKQSPTFGGFHDGAFHVLFGDGSVRLLAQDTEQETLKRLIEMADGKTVQVPDDVIKAGSSNTPAQRLRSGGG